jgi:hypothetical protein
MLEPQLPLNIDSTMISCFRSCPRKFYLEFVLGLRPPGLSIDLHAGACMASAIEETYRQIYFNKRSLDEALQIAYARYCIEWGDFQIPTWKKTSKTLDRCWDAIVGDGTPEGIGYFQEYPPHSDVIKPFIAADGQPTLEYSFAIPLEDDFPEHPNGGPFLYSGRFDMLAQTQDGTPIPKDDKTTGRSPSSEWSRMWQLRSQFMGYVWACQQCGLPTNEVCIRGIGILKEKIVHAQQIQPYSQDLIERWYEQLRRDLWRIRKAWDENHWDYNFAESCTSYGNCVFMDSCSAREPLSWLSDMEVRRWNPLEKNPTKVADPSQVSAI